MTPAANRRNEIQWLRALAACEIVAFHSDVMVKGFSPDRITFIDWYRPVAAVGVELFFIVSGYIMCMRAPRAGNFMSFIVSRITRIYPLYWLFTTLVVVVGTVVPAWRLGRFTLNASTISRSYLVLPGWGDPLLGVGWTLEYEMVFYLLVSLLMALGMVSGRRLAGFAVVLAALGCIGCAIGPQTEGSPLRYHIFSPYMFAFGAGWLFRSIEDAPPKRRISEIALFAVFAAVAVWIGPDWGDRLIFRISFAALVFVGFLATRRVFQADNRVNRSLWLVGDASYCIYLSHWFVLSACGKLLGALAPPADTAWLARIGGGLLSVAVGMAVFQYLQKPLDRLLRGGAFLGRRTDQAPGAVQH